MRLLFLTASPASLELAQWLRPQCKQLTVLAEPIDADQVLEHDLVVSYGYRHLLPAPLLGLRRFVNLHVSLLPFNRGADPNVWSHLEGTPSGVSIHEIDAGIDTGPLLAQRALAFGDGETLRSSYDALQREIQALFRDAWPELRAGRLRSRPQQGAGSFHRARQFLAIRDRLLGAEGWDVPLPLLKARWRELTGSS